jgi:hypothetical protein
MAAPKKEETIKLRLAVSARLYAYLRVLRQKTMLGASENDVAEFLLTQRLEQMLNEKYHEKQVPPQSDFQSSIG